MALATADKHRAHLRELAEVTGQAVGLGVHGQVLGSCEGLFEQLQARDASPSVGRIARPGAKPSPRGPSFDGWLAPAPCLPAPPAASRRPSGTAAALAAASGTRSPRRRGPLRPS